MNNNTIIGAAIMFLFCAASCHRSDNIPAQAATATFTMAFDGAAAPAARASYDQLTGVWEADDIVYAYLTSTDSETYGPYEFTPDGAGVVATFSAVITGIPAGTEIASIDAFHHTGLDDVRFNNGVISYSLPAVCDGTLSYLTVSSYEYPADSRPEAAEGSEIDITEALTFSHCLSRIDISTDIPSVREVTLSIAGEVLPTAGTLNISDGITAAASFASLLRATPSDNFQIGIIPVDFGSGRTLKATVTTDDGRVYTREVTVSRFARATRYTLLLNAADMTEATAVADEQGFAAMTDGNYVLTSDLTLSQIPHIDGFSGSLDGNGHTIDISGATAATTSGQGGIFATTTGDAAIRNLYIIGGDRQTSMAEGGLLVGMVSESSSLTLDNIHATGNITTSRDSNASHLFAGGIAGFVPATSQITITNSTFSGSVTIDQTGTTSLTFKNAYVGGIIGCIETAVSDFTQTASYAGSTAGSASAIIGCSVTDTTLNNTNDGSYDAPFADISRSEIYTGGIAGRCTGLILDCRVSNTVIAAISEGDGSGRQARPVVGNDWYENSDNARNTYINITINGNAPASGTYNGLNIAGSTDNRYRSN